MTEDVAAPSLREQADEVELHLIDLRDQLHRALARQIKRSDDWATRVRQRIVVAEASVRTLRAMDASGVRA